MISGPSHDGPIFFTTALFQRTKIMGDVANDLVGRRHRSTRVANEKPQLKGAISYPLHFCKKSEHNNQIDDAAAVERRPTLSRHHGRRGSIAFGMLATTAAAGIADERHRITDEDGRR
jgi:hypothetical protein